MKSDRNNCHTRPTARTRVSRGQSAAGLEAFITSRER